MSSEPWALPDWREGAPNALLSVTGPRGELIETPQDHRWLWHLEGELSLAPQNPTVDLLRRRLRSYLNESCQHHWLSYDGDTDIPAHNQCMWCCAVRWADELPAGAA